MKRSIPLAILATGLLAAFTLPIGAAEKKKAAGPRVGDCKAAVSETGTQVLGESWAKSSARNDWVQKVRFKHGEQYIDIGKAKNVKYRCTPTGVLGLTRCEVTATPCREL